MLWGAKGGCGRSKGRGGRTTERGRGEVNLSPRGHWDVGNGERGTEGIQGLWTEGASKPPVAQRAGGIFGC